VAVEAFGKLQHGVEVGGEDNACDGDCQYDERGI
jgi:hypothetical protein